MSRKRVISFAVGLIFCFVWGAHAVAFDINPLIFNDLKKDGTYLKMTRSGSLKDEGIKALAKSPMVKKVNFWVLIVTR